MNKNADSNFLRTVKGFSSQTVVTIVLGVVEVIIFSVMSRLLTKEDFGYYSAMTAITVVFSSFSDTGIGSAIIQKKNINKQYIDNAFTMCFIIGALLMLLLICLAKPLSLAVVDTSLMIPLMFMSVTLLCNCLTSVNNSLMYKGLHFLKVGVVQLTAISVSGVIAITLAANGFGFYAILTQVVVASVLSFLLSYFVSGAKYHFYLSKKTSKEIWGFSGWLMASAVFRNLAQQIDNLMMPRLMSVEALGAYDRPRKFVEMSSSKFNSIFDITLFPILSGIQDDKNAMKRAFDKILFFMGLAGTALFVLFFFNAELLIRIFLGEKWLNLTMLFRIFSIAIVFKVYGRLADCFLRSLAMTKYQFFFRIAEFIVKIPAIFIGVKWGLYGIAISVVMADIVMRLIKVWFVAAQIDYSVKEVLCRIIISGRSLLVILPLIISLFLLLPHTVVGNILLAISSLCIYIIVFFFLPSLVGSIYRDNIWNVVTKKIGINERIRKKCI